MAPGGELRPQALLDEADGGADVLLPRRPVLVGVLAAVRRGGQGPVDQGGELRDVALRQVGPADRVPQDRGQQAMQLAHVLAQLLVVLRGEDGAHGGARGQVAPGEVLDLGADVDGEPVDRVGDALEVAAQVGHEPLGLVQGVGHEELAHVREVVVDRGAAHAGVLGHVRHGQTGEALLVEQLAEGVSGA